MMRAYWESAFEMESGHIFDEALEQIEEHMAKGDVDINERQALIGAAQASGHHTLDHVLRKGARYHDRLLEAAGADVDTA
jgi:hypothetical protein